MIFPYENSKLIRIEQMLVKYPNAWEYFQKHKEELLPKQLGGSRMFKIIRVKATGINMGEHNF